MVCKDGLILEYNKKEMKPGMKFINYGLGVLSKSLFDMYKENEIFDLADLYHQLSLKGQLASFEVYERFYEIGSHQGIKETELYLSAN